MFFDFDMTLINSKNLLERSYRDLEHKYSLSFKDLSMREIVGMPHKKFIKSLIKLNKSKHHWKEVLDYDTKSMERLYSNARLTNLKFLQDLNERKINIGIISNNEEQVVLRCLKNKYNKKIKIDFVLAGKNGEGNKKKAFLIKKGLRLLNLEKENILYVGDHPNDICAAKEAKVKCVAVSTGLHSPKELKGFHPYKLVDNLNQIKIDLI